MKTPQIEAIPGMSPLGFKPQPVEKKIRLMKHYVTDGVTKARVHYSRGKQIDGRDCVTLYGKHYERDLHSIFPNAENDTDMQTDYFANSRVRIFEGDALWAEACARAERKVWA